MLRERERDSEILYQEYSGCLLTTTTTFHLFIAKVVPSLLLLSWLHHHHHHHHHDHDFQLLSFSSLSNNNVPSFTISKFFFLSHISSLSKRMMMKFLFEWRHMIFIHFSCKIIKRIKIQNKKRENRLYSLWEREREREKKKLIHLNTNYSFDLIHPESLAHMVNAYY